MEYSSDLLLKVSYSVVSPFDLSSSNEVERNLTPASAGKLVSDELINTNNAAALICVFNAASYDQLSVYLDGVFSVFNIEKIRLIKNACDYMAGFESNKRLSVPAIASSVFKIVPIESLNVSNQNFHDVVASYEVEQDLSVDAAIELAALETFKRDSMTDIQENIATVKNSLATTSNKLLVSGSADAMAEQINNHCEGLPQNTPFTVALCFSGSLAAVNYIDSMIVG